MNYSEFESLFHFNCRLNTINELPQEQMQAFFDFTEHLLKVNQTTNLTAIRSIEEIIPKHYIDSLFASEYIPNGAKVLDIGCGPGFPSIPLAIARPDLQIIALDSTQKKISFVTSAAKELKLQNLKAISARAEDHALLFELGKFDIVTSRAVARLNMLCELALPYVGIGGSLLALKAAKAEEELSEAKKAIYTLGGEIIHIHTKELYTSPSASEERAIIEITKIKKTPSTYPRAFATIKKKPL